MRQDERLSGLTTNEFRKEMKKRKLCNGKPFDMLSRLLVFEDGRINHVKFSKSQIDEHSKETFMSALSIG